MNTSDARIVAQAIQIVSKNMRKPGAVLSSPQTVKDHLVLHLANLERETFGVIWLDVKNTLIAAQDMFCGTLTQASVYPREVVKAGLSHNATSMICYHNHPSGCSNPSEADVRLTKALKEALSLIDIRVLDHIIVAGANTYSFAEYGII
jgi:DNA repair protein RadC